MLKGVKQIYLENFNKFKIYDSYLFKRLLTSINKNVKL